MSALRSAALVGNPNAGKSALFNALTGARQKIANYPGVTVERKAGRLLLPSGEPVALTDLPGSYSLTPTSPDEEVTRKVILGEFPGEPAPQVLVWCSMPRTSNSIWSLRKKLSRWAAPP